MLKLFHIIGGTMSKKSLVGLVASIVSFVALMIVATFYDLQISVAIGNADSVYGQFFNFLGETPLWFGIPLSFLILFRAVDKSNKFYKWLKPVLLICVFVGFFFFARYLMDEMTAELKWKYLYVSLFGLAMTGVALLCVKNIDDEVFKKLVIFAILTLAIIVVSQALVTAMKHIWSRQRFRNLQVGNVYLGTSEGFTPWYKPTFGRHNPDVLYPDALGGKSDKGAYRSFPSGHTAAAAVTFAITILPDLFEKLKKYKAVFYVVPVVYTALVAVSRIVNRAHYLSDVTVGGFLTAGIAFLFKYLIQKIWIKRKFYGYENFAEPVDNTNLTEKAA